MASQAAPILKVISLVFRSLIGLVVLAVAIGIFSALVASKPELPPNEQNTAALVVGTVPATRIDVQRMWTGYGTARSMNSANLAAEVAGSVIERPGGIEAGAVVAQGDLLVQIQQTDYLARLKATEQAATQGEADLAAIDVDEAAWTEQLRLVEEQASIEERELAQALNAFEANAASQSEIDSRTKSVRALEVQASTIRQQLGRIPSNRAALQANLERLRADIDVAEQNLRRTSITSPIDGVIESVGVEQDEFVNIGARVARVVDIAHVEVPVRIPASALGRVRVGDSATLHPDGPGTHTWQGKVGRISPEIDPGTRSITVFIEVRQDATAFVSAATGADTLLLPGSFVLVEITGAVEPDSLIVPRRAVQEGVVFLAEPRDEGGWVARKFRVEPLFTTRGTHPEIDPIEEQWAALGPSDIPDGAPIIVTNLDVMIDGLVVDTSSRVSSGSGR